MSVEFYPWLSESDNRVAQLLDILNRITDDYSINVGYPGDLLREWEKEHPEVVESITRINRHANWAHDHYSRLWHADKRTMIEMDADTTMGSGHPNSTLADLEALSVLIGEAVERVEAAIVENDLTRRDHFDHPAVVPLLEVRDNLFIDFARGSRKLDLARHRARNRKAK